MDEKDLKPQAPLPSKERLASLANKLNATPPPPLTMEATQEVKRAENPIESMLNREPETSAVATNFNAEQFLVVNEAGGQTQNYIGSAAADYNKPHDWSRDQDAQLITYIKSSSSYQEIADKMKLPIHVIRWRAQDLHEMREHFSMIKKSLGR